MTQQHPHANKERSGKKKERMGGGGGAGMRPRVTDLVEVLYCTFSFHFTVPLQSQLPLAERAKERKGAGIVQRAFYIAVVMSRKKFITLFFK